jgi:apolipoprotein N-acyltransferase
MNAPPDEGGRRPPAARGRRLALAAGCVSSAVLLGVAQDVRGAEALALIGFLPLALVLRPERLWKSWGLLAAFHVLYNLMTLWWMIFWGPGYYWVLLIICFYAVVTAGVPAVCCRLGGLLALPAGWALMELGVRDYLFRITWAVFGQALGDWPAVARVSSFAGPELLTFLCVACGVSGAVWLRPVGRVERILALVQGPGLLAAAVAAAYFTAPVSTTEGVLRIAVIQPDTAVESVRDAAGRDEFLRTLDRLIDRTLPERPDIIALPETAFPGLVRYDNALTEWVKGTVLRTRLPLLFGTFDREESDPNRAYNAAILVTPYGTVTTYRKTQLVPFGERVPDPWPFRKQLNAALGNVLEVYPGNEATVFRLADGRAFSTPLCSEEAAPDLAREFASSGAKLLVSLVNTARVKDTCQAMQQLRRARLTAAAVGLPLVRCASGGPSCVVTPDGQVRGALQGPDGKPVRGEGAGVLEVRMGRVETLYRQFGDTLALQLYLTALAVSAVWTRRRGLPMRPRHRISAPPHRLPGEHHLMPAVK